MMMAVLGVGAIIAGMLSPPPDTLGGWIIGIVLLLAAFTSLQRRKPR
jgi:hypothetical protein